MAELDALKSAMLMNAGDELQEEIAVKAEDRGFEGSGIKFEDHFFEPQPGGTYTVKFLQNPEGENIVFRRVYKKLPDPTRKGKTFQYVSSGVAKTCKVLELFFELNNLKKGGDPVAEKKIEEFLSQTNQGCALVQILSAPEKEKDLVGKVRMYMFSTFGPNANIANLIDKKVHPSPDMLKAGKKRENIFNVFGSKALMIVCKETTYNGIKAREYASSDWTDIDMYPYVIYEKDGKQIKHEFKPSDFQNGNLTSPEVEEAFGEFLKVLTNPDYSIHNYFAYKELDDPKNTEDTKTYLKSVLEKVEEIVPIIREKSIQEIKNYGKAETTSGNGGGDSAKTIGNKSAAEILNDSAPTELEGSTLNQNETKATTAKVPETKVKADTVTDDVDVDKILNS